MQIAARPIVLFSALALGSFALGAVTTSRWSAVPAVPGAVQAIPSSGGDPSVPRASTVTFPVGEETAAPTF